MWNNYEGLGIGVGGFVEYSCKARVLHSFWLSFTHSPMTEEATWNLCQDCLISERIVSAQKWLQDRVLWNCAVLECISGTVVQVSARGWWGWVAGTERCTSLSVLVVMGLWCCMVNCNDRKNIICKNVQVHFLKFWTNTEILCSKPVWNST